MNLNIAICDDDTNDITIMKKNILQYTIETDNNIVVSSYFSASDILSDYKNHLYQIVLLDIEMPDINGMELARQLRDMMMICSLYLQHPIRNICTKALKSSHFNS